MKKKVNLTSSLLLCLAIATQLYGMEEEKGPKLTWGQEGDVQRDNSNLTMQEKSFYTKSGLNFLQSRLNGKPESSSNYKALDVADDRTQGQRKLKVTALLNAQQKQENPRGSLLQKVMCSPTALHNWHKTLSQKPSLYREGWSQETDKDLACSLLAATKLRALLKNQYLMHENNQLIIAKDVDYWGQSISPNQQYLFAKVNNSDATLINLITQEQLYHYAHTWDKSLYRMLKSAEEVCEFSADNRFCFFIEKSNEKLNYQWTDICSMHAFDLKTKQLVKMPENVTVKQFSPNCTFAVLRIYENEQDTDDVQAIFDVKKQEIVATYPIPDRYYRNASFSHNGRWCFLYADSTLKLLDLENGCKEVDWSTDKLDGNYDDVIWHSNGCCFIKKSYKYHASDITLCQGCLHSTEPRETCPNGELRKSFYILYDPATNKQLKIFQAVSPDLPLSFSPDGKYCYIINAQHRTGHLYDLQENKTVTEFKNVGTGVCGNEKNNVLFSKDPDYPYFTAPICIKHGETDYEIKVIVYDLKQKKIVPPVTDRKNVFLAQWPEKGPYYYIYYINETADNSKSNSCLAIEFRQKKTGERVLQVDNAQLARSSSPDGSHCVIDDNDEGVLLIDMVNKKVLRKFENGRVAGTFLKNGALYEQKYSTSLRQVLPPDPDWSKITTQQILFMLYAYQRWQKHNFVDLTQKNEQPLCSLFESLDKYMQTYVARACKIKREEK